MNNIKKPLAPLLLVILTTTLVSCGSGGGGGSPDPSPTTELTLSAGNPLPSGASEKVTISMSPKTTSAGQLQTDSTTTITLKASNTNVVAFPIGNTCTITGARGSCTVPIKNTNSSNDTVSSKLTAYSSDGTTTSKILQFIGQTTPTSTGDISLDNTQGASETITTNHAYPVTFTFKNNSGNTLTNVESTIESNTNGFISGITNNCTNLSALTAGATCTIKATLTSTESLTSYPTTFHFSYTNDGTASTDNVTKTFVAINNSDTSQKQMAVRVVNTSPTSTLYAVAETNKYNGSSVAQTNNLIPLTKGTSKGDITLYQGSTQLVQCAAAPTGCEYKNNSIAIAPGKQAVLLLPAGNVPINATATGISGVIYLSLDKPLNDGVAPSVTNSSDPNFTTRWAQFEYTLVSSDSANPNAKPKYTVDLTAVDFVSLPLVFEAQQDASGVPISIGDVSKNNNMVEGIKAAYQGQPMQTILNNIATVLEAAPQASDSWSKLVQRSGNQIVRVISPNIGNGVSAFQMPTNYFTEPTSGINYSADLWNYYKPTSAGGKGHILLIDLSSLPNCTGLIMGGQVSETNGVYSFSFTPKTSVPTGCNITNPTVITAISNNTTGLPNNYDFFGGAGNSNYAITWGVNGSSKSEIGKAIVAAQSVGLMPYPDGETLSAAGIQAKKSQYYTDTQTQLLESDFSRQYTRTMYNLYSKAVDKYFNYYNYPYSDYLGEDGTVADTNVQLTPITLTLAG